MRGLGASIKNNLNALDASVIQDYRRKISHQHWGSAYNNVLAQTYRSVMDDNEVAAFAWLHGMIAVGNIGRVEVEVGEAPHSDESRAANHTPLGALPAPFTGVVDPHQAHGPDGYLAWDAKIRLTREIEDGAPAEIDPNPILPPDMAALEVGSCGPQQLMARIIEYGHVARWPYGCTDITLLARLDEKRPGKARLGRIRELERP